MDPHLHEALSSFKQAAHGRMWRGTIVLEEKEMDILRYQICDSQVTILMVLRKLPRKVVFMNL